MKRGNTAAASTYVGPLGELLVDTGLQTIRIQDGVTAGGWLVGGGGSVDLSSVNANIAVLATRITYSNTAIATANTAMKGYVDTLTSALRANITAANLAIVSTNSAITTANTGMKSYVDAQIATKTTASYVNSAISTAINNLINSAPGTLDTLGEIAANLASEGSAVASITSSITGLRSNAATQQTQINSLLANVGSANTGDLRFISDAMYNLGGVIVENADLTHNATSAVIVPANGTSDPLQVNNYYGPVNVTTGPNPGDLKSWIFGTDGKLSAPQNIGVDINWTSDTAGGGPGDQHYDSLRINNDHLYGLYITNTMDGTPTSWLFGKNGQLHSPQGGVIGDTYGDGRGTSIAAGSASNSYAGINSYTGDQWFEADNNAVYIGTNYLSDGGNVWTFNKNGSLQFPDGSTQTTAWQLHAQNTAPAGGLWYNTDDGRTYVKFANTWVDASPTVAPAPSYYLGNLSITDTTIYSGESAYTFGIDGNLIVPGAVQSSAIQSTTGNLLLSSNTAEPELAWAISNDMFGPGSSALLSPVSDAQHIGALVFRGNTGTGQLGWAGPVGSPYDNSLFVGATGNVVIASNYGTLWKFDGNGNLTLPTGGSINYANGHSILTGITAGSTYGNANVAQYLNHYDNAITWTDGTQILVDSGLYLSNGTAVGVNVGEASWAFDVTGGLTLPGGAKITGAGYKFATDNTVTTNLDLRDASGRGFYTDSNGYTLRSNGTYNWVFGTDGNLTLPSNVAAINYANGHSILSGITSGTSTGNITFSGSDITGTDSNVTITADTTDWIFGHDGELYLPSGGRIGTAGKGWTGIDGGNGNPLSLTGYYSSGMYSSCITLNIDGSLSISTYGDGTGQTGSWIFGADGSTTFPESKPVAISGNLTVGNLTVNGTSTTINTASYTVEDNIIQIANGNPADTLDLGFVAHRTVGGQLEHTGLVRNASLNQWELFSNVVPQPGTTVDFTNAIYDNLQLGQLKADTIHLTGTAPTSPAGNPGDLAGDIHVDNNYIYRCFADYVDQHYSATSNTLYTSDGVWHIDKGSYPQPQPGWTITGQTYPYPVGGPHTTTIATVTDEGATWGITGDGIANNGVITAQPVTFYNPVYPAIWKTIPLTAFGNVAYGDANVAAYLASHVPTGTYSNANVASYLTTQTFYSNANVAAYLSGNVTTGNITSTSVSTGHLVISGSAPGTTLGSAGDLQYELRADSNYLYVSTGAYGGSNIATPVLGFSGSIGTNYYGVGHNRIILTGVPSGYWTGIRTSPQVYWYSQVAAVAATYMSDDGAGAFSFDVGTRSGYAGSNQYIIYATGSSIWQTIPLSSFQTPAFGNANVSAYLTANPQAGTYSNVNVASYLTAGVSGNVKTSANVIGTTFMFANGVNILSTVAGTYSNTNVSSYLSGGVTTGNLTTTGNVVQQSAYYETYGNISNTGGNLTCSFNAGTVFYATLTANVTANFTNVNAISSTVSGATIVVDQGATAYRVANVQVNGVNQTVRWVGATAGAGTASNTDVMSFSLIHLGGGAYRVLGQISNYG